MAKQEKPKPGCFTNFLQILLCSGNGTGPPVHPSDHVTEQDGTEQVHMHSEKGAIFEDTAATPGVVARLMGLDSLPKTNFSTKGATPDSVPRSRSVNFVDYLLNFDVNRADSIHRLAKTSASFREVPVSNRGKQDRDFVVFTWDGNVCKEHEAGFDLRDLEIGLEEEEKQRKKQGKKQGTKNNEIVLKKERNIQGKKNKKISKLKNEPRRVPRIQKQSEEAKEFSSSGGSKSCSYKNSGGSSSSTSSQIQNKKKKEFVESSVTKKVRKQKSQKSQKKKMENDYNSENLSPISVLDINDCHFLDGTRSLASKSNWESSSLRDGVDDSTGNNEGCACSYTDITKEAEYYLDLMLKLHTLTEKDIRELDFTTKLKCEYEDFEEICLVFEHKILDLLLHEVVNEVVEFSC